MKFGRRITAPWQSPWLNYRRKTLKLVGATLLQTSSQQGSFIPPGLESRSLGLLTLSCFYSVQHPISWRAFCDSLCIEAASADFVLQEQSVWGRGENRPTAGKLFQYFCKLPECRVRDVWESFIYLVSYLVSELVLIQEQAMNVNEALNWPFPLLLINNQ